jgi:FixJ family two-component response regulator
MIPENSTVFLVDDDPGVLKALSRLLTAKGYNVRTFCSPQLFVDQHDTSVGGCAILDLAMPGLDGLQVQSVLEAGSVPRPIIFLTGRGDVPTSVKAMKAGAVDFLSKPADARELMPAIERAVEQDARARRLREELNAISAKLARLTPREHEVLRHVIAGQLNKQIAFEIGTVEKTAKVHRGRVMKKLGMRTVVELVWFAQKAGITPYPPQTDDVSSCP